MTALTGGSHPTGSRRIIERSIKQLVTPRRQQRVAGRVLVRAAASCGTLTRTGGHGLPPPAAPPRRHSR